MARGVVGGCGSWHRVGLWQLMPLLPGTWGDVWAQRQSVATDAPARGCCGLWPCHGGVLRIVGSRGRLRVVVEAGTKNRDRSHCTTETHPLNSSPPQFIQTAKAVPHTYIRDNSANRSLERTQASHPQDGAWMCAYWPLIVQKPKCRNAQLDGVPIVAQARAHVRL